MKELFKQTTQCNVAVFLNRGLRSLYRVMRGKPGTKKLVDLDGSNLTQAEAMLTVVAVSMDSGIGSPLMLRNV